MYGGDCVILMLCSFYHYEVMFCCLAVANYAFTLIAIV